MSDDMFFLMIALLIVGAKLVLIGQTALWLMNRSDLYSQDRYDKAFWAIVKREKRLDKQRARNERYRETADGHYHF